MLSDPKRTKDDIVRWIRKYFSENGPDCSAVIGISGGKDSSIVAALCAEALGKERVVGVMMPNGAQPDIQDSKRIIGTLGIRSLYLDICEVMFDFLEVIGGDIEVSEQAVVNLAPRVRMAALYAVAQSLPNGGRVANTCNYSEDFVGYSTKFGDNVGDFSPLGRLLVSEVKQIGYELPIPRELVDKTPSDGLCGKTDEDNLGVSYAEIDRYISEGCCAVPANEWRIKELHDKNVHKLNPMPVFNG